ncbi:MAG: hypothetical protein HY541_06435 [Deltaproteobacteria bacterium]|nr:hypothetical protein [Deltaproteobacteria bacterium]
MEHRMTANRSDEASFMCRIEFCPNGVVHLSYGPTTLHFTALGFLKLMARGQETVEKIRYTMEGAEETGFVH